MECPFRKKLTLYRSNAGSLMPKTIDISRWHAKNLRCAVNSAVLCYSCHALSVLQPIHFQ